MQVSVETTSNLERKVTVGVPAEQVDSEVVKRLQDAAKKAKINGFRAGKVPFKVVKQRYGMSIRQEVIGEVINRTYFEAIQKEDLKPAGMPSIDLEKDNEGESLEYVATVEVYPEIQLVDFSSIEIAKPTATVDDSDIDAMVQKLRTQQGTMEKAERAAKEGDQVIIDYVGTKGGEEFAGGKAEKQTLLLGSNQMIPGFETGIVGMSAGEDKTIALTFPEDYQSEDLKGAAVEFAIKLHEVQESKLPELDDDFFKKFGVEEGGEAAFRVEVKKNMERELKNAVKNKIKTQVMDGVIAVQSVDIPKALVTNEIQNMRKQMMEQFGGAAKNMDMASLLPDTMFEEQASKRVALGLIMGEVIKVNDISPAEDKVQDAIQELAATYHDPEAVIQYYSTNQDAKASVEAMVLEDQAVEYILSSAKVSEEPSSYEALTANQQNDNY